jgi:hypothetical protein
LQFRRVSFKLVRAYSELRSGSRSTQPNTTRNDHKPDLRVFLEWMMTGSGSVITAVIQPEKCFLEIAEPEFVLSRIVNWKCQANFAGGMLGCRMHGRLGDLRR